MSTVDITIAYHKVPIQGIGTNTEKWYRYRRSVQIQKIVPIQGIVTNTGKHIIFEKYYK